LLKFSTVGVAKLSASSTKVVRRNVLKAHALCAFAYDIPDNILRDPSPPARSVSACLAHAVAWPEGVELQPTFPHESTAGSGGGRSGTEDTWPASRPTARHCRESTAHRSIRPACRARDGHGCPGAAAGRKNRLHQLPLFVCQFPTACHTSPQRRLEQSPVSQNIGCQDVYEIGSKLSPRTKQPG
jgi:hypothetical protein